MKYVHTENIGFISQLIVHTLMFCYQTWIFQMLSKRMVILSGK